MNDLRTFLTETVAVEDVRPRLRRITFAGGDLSSFETVGPDTFVYLLLPPPGHTELTVDRSFTWEQYLELPEARRPVGAYYTVRDWCPSTESLAIHVVLHDPAGAASTWAERAVVGDPVALWGPRSSFDPPVGTSRFLLVADDTALPAVARIIESMTPGQTAIVVAEVEGDDDHRLLPRRDGVDVEWVHRRGAPAGTSAIRIVERLRELALDDERTYAWGGGETRTMTAARRVLRAELGWPRDRVSMLPYWCRGDVSGARRCDG